MNMATTHTHTYIYPLIYFNNDQITNIMCACIGLFTIEISVSTELCRYVSDLSYPVYDISLSVLGISPIKIENHSRLCLTSPFTSLF